MIHIGLNIADLRVSRGWTQAELAERLGIAQANLSNIEKGKRDFTVSTLLRLAEALEVNPSQILEELSSASKVPSLTRTQIENLAEAVVCPEKRISAQVRKLADLLRSMEPSASARQSSKKIQRAWIELRKGFTSDQLREILRRIEDARQRAHA